MTASLCCDSVCSSNPVALKFLYIANGILFRKYLSFKSIDGIKP